jgi:hypothetical protein
MEVRGALLTSSNTTGVLGSNAGGAEIQKRIEEMPVQAFNSKTDLAPLLRRVNINQLSFIWNLTTEDSAGSGVTNTSFSFHSEGGTNTPNPSTKTQLYGVAKGYRADYDLSGLMLAAGMGDQLLEEAKYAAEALAIGEEKQIVSGTDSDAYGVSGGFDGLSDLISSNATFAAVNSKYGTNMATARLELNSSLVAAGATSLDDLSLADLDSAITLSNKRGAKGNRRVFFCSEERLDEIAQLLQAQQRFVSTGNTVEFDGGFRVLAYRRIPIVGSRFMDKAGILYTGSTNTDWDSFREATDKAMYLLDIDNIFMAHVAGVNATHVPIVGGAAANYETRADVKGGYYKSYGVLVVRRFDTQVLIYNLNTP